MGNIEYCGIGAADKAGRIQRNRNRLAAARCHHAICRCHINKVRLSYIEQGVGHQRRAIRSGLPEIGCGVIGNREEVEVNAPGVAGGRGHRLFHNQGPAVTVFGDDNGSIRQRATAVVARGPAVKGGHILQEWVLGQMNGTQR